jgi:hypothetical protein
MMTYRDVEGALLQLLCLGGLECAEGGTQNAL